MSEPLSTLTFSARLEPIDGLADGAERRRIREDLDATLVVEAAAGTGKTTELVHRIVAVLRAGKGALDRLVAVTFTEKAAGELKLRLRSGIERARNDPAASEEEQKRLASALAELEVARIGTIHSLCADLLRERPVEARVDPLFEVMDEEQAHRLFDASFDRWFQEALANPREGVRRVLRRKQRGPSRTGSRRALREAAWKLAEQRDFHAAWRRDPFEREASIDAVVIELAALAPLAAAASDPNDWLAKNLQRIARFIEELERKERVAGRDYDGLEAELVELATMKEWKYSGYRTLYGPSLARADVKARREAAKAMLDAFVAGANADLAACLHAELRPITARYDALKVRAGKLDFVDLLLRTRGLVQSDAAVRRELQQRFTHVFVDEFQDTDPLQAEILLLIASDDPDVDDWEAVTPIPGKLFVVGDPKQSIYRFRRADVALYERIKQRLSERGVSVLQLSTSFRSAPSIQEAVNVAFEPVMQGGTNGSQARYVALERYREDTPGQPAIVALPVPEPYGDWGKIANWAIEASIPDAVGAFIDWLVNKSGWKVSERETPGSLQSIKPRHIAILFKRFHSFDSDLTRPFVRALELRRIPHVLVGGRSFHDREEVLAIHNALRAIEWPDDELSVYATLRGPFLAFGDDALLAFRTFVGALHPLHEFDESKLTDFTRPIHAKLMFFRELHRKRNRRPIADSIAELLESARAHAGIAIWPTGEQALANVLRILDLARRFEGSGATSFRAFVEWFDEQQEGGSAGEAPVVEEGTEGVRIMTVHRAKGLEFPVVVLGDPTVPATFREPTRHTDAAKGLCSEPLAGCTPIELVEHRKEALERDAEESARLAYVAATRARDLLVVPVNGDEVIKGWLEALNPVLYPPGDRDRDAQPAPGCPSFGPDSVRYRPSQSEKSVDQSVAPGLHLPRKGKHHVVWWDPFLLGKGSEAGALRQVRLLQEDDARVRSDAGRRGHEEWAAARKERAAAGATPTLKVVAATELKGAGRAANPWDRVEIASTDRPPPSKPRPSGRRFGTLVHAILAEVDLDALPSVVTGMARAQGRIIGATPAEIEAAATAVQAALAHSVLRRAAASGETRRETPVLVPRADGSLLEGVVDLAFREIEPYGPVWTVVDFKTDVELEAFKGRYIAQVRLYAHAIAEVTGENARGVILSV